MMRNSLFCVRGSTICALELLRGALWKLLLTVISTTAGVGGLFLVFEFRVSVLTTDCCNEAGPTAVHQTKPFSVLCLIGGLVFLS